MQKICSKCKDEKDTSEFNKNSTKKDGLQYICKVCQAEYTKAHYESTKDVYSSNARKRRLELKRWMKDYKKNLSCKNCPEDHPSCLQFHHRDPKEKEMCLSHAQKSGWCIDRLQKEIAKCDVLCANCHFKHHYNECH
jgi:hypothetical protein